MTTHRVLVPTFVDGALREAGETINYSGKPDWKLKPTDLGALSIWAATVKRPPDADAQIARANWSPADALATLKGMGLQAVETATRGSHDPSLAIKQRLGCNFGGNDGN